MSADTFRALTALGLNTDQIAGVLEIFDAQTEQRRADGRKRWANWKARQDAEKASKQLQQTANVSSPLVRVEGSSSKEEISGKERKKDYTPQAAFTPRQELETVLDAERAKAVIDHRQRIGKPLTAHAAKLLAHSLAKWHDANEAADAMVENGWQGFKPEWLENRQAAQPRAGTGPPPTKKLTVGEYAINNIRTGNFSELPIGTATRRDEPRDGLGHGASVRFLELVAKKAERGSPG